MTTNIDIASTHAAAPADANAATEVLPNTNAVAGAADTPGDVSTETARAPDMSAAIPQEDVALEAHEYANIFPELSDDRLAELVQDIREHGLLDKIDLYEDKILDGRGRYRACRMAGVEPQYEDFKGANPLAYVASHNLHRRHLTESQRAMVAARLADLQRGANQHSQGLPIGRAAELVNVSQRSVARAKEVLRQGSPALLEDVTSGKVTVSAATNQLRRAKADARTARAKQKTSNTGAAIAPPQAAVESPNQLELPEWLPLAAETKARSADLAPTVVSDEVADQSPPRLSDENIPAFLDRRPLSPEDQRAFDDLMAAWVALIAAWKGASRFVHARFQAEVHLTKSSAVG